MLPENPFEYAKEIVTKRFIEHLEESVVTDTALERKAKKRAEKEEYRDFVTKKVRRGK